LDYNLLQTVHVYFQPLRCGLIGPKVAKFGKNNGRYAVQGHSVLSILVAIESPYATVY